MDVLTEVLNSLRLKSTVYCRAELDAPWSLSFEPLNMAAFHVVNRGSCWLQTDGNTAPLKLEAGDVVVLPGGTGHLLGDELYRPRYISIRLDHDVPPECRLISNQGEAENGIDLLCGTFEFEHAHGHPVLELLPEVLHLQGQSGRAAAGLDLTLDILGQEATSQRPGSQTLLRRMADVLFVQVVRCWIERGTDHKPGWLRALNDPQISRALGLLHQQPGQDWTVAGLAAEVAMSRSAFAARFTSLAGEPPLQYLTRWRMQLAADLIHQPGLELADIAEQVGYKSEDAFSKAFKRQFHLAPGAYRRRLRTPVRPLSESV